MFATKTRLFGIFSAVVLSFGLAACGDDDDGGTGGVDGDKQLNELTDADEIALCEANKDLTADIGEYFAIATCYGQMAETCDDAAAQTCIDGITGQPDTCEASSEPETCTATVNEALACLRAQRDAFGGIIEGMNCANAEAKFAELEAAPTPAACQVIETKCPDDQAQKRLIKSRF